jgi:hypothetical protein
MRSADTSRSSSIAAARPVRAAFSCVGLALVLCAGCSVDDRALLTTEANAAPAGAGGRPTVVDLDTGGTAGEAGETGRAALPRCYYAGKTVEAGCETLVNNPGFASNVAGWVAEDVGITEGWLNVDASANPDSGSLVVTNTNFKDDDTAIGGTAPGGARQCLRITGGMSFDLAADIFIPDGQGMGFMGSYTSVAALSLFFYPDTACAEMTEGNFTSPAVQKSNSWVHVEGSVQTPKDTQSMAVRLATQKPFRQYTFEAHFDNVLLRQHTP